jgi:hypothetical protein
MLRRKGLPVGHLPIGLADSARTLLVYEWIVKVRLAWFVNVHA